MLEQSKILYEIKDPAAGRSVPLSIKSEYLQEGAKYKFQLDVNNADGSSLAEVEITVNSAPECAQLKVRLSLCSWVRSCGTAIVKL